MNMDLKRHNSAKEINNVRKTSIIALHYGLNSYLVASAPAGAVTHPAGHSTK